MKDVFTDVPQPYSCQSKQEISDHLLIGENRYIDKSVVKLFEVREGSTD
jgi:hypothetical protein